MSEMTLGTVVKRFFLYVGIAVGVLVVFGAAIILSKGAIGRLPGAWIALVVFTVCLFWVVIRQSRAYWHRVGFWLAIVGLLIVHSLAFVAILRSYPQWREIWFWPVMLIEAGLFGATFYLLFGKQKKDE